MIYTPSIPSTSPESSTASRGATNAKGSTDFNFSTILCVSWSACGRNIALGTPDGFLVFSTEQAVENHMAVSARDEAGLAADQNRHTPCTPQDKTVESSTQPTGSPTPRQAVTLSSASRTPAKKSTARHGSEDEEAESLASLSPLASWSGGEEEWSIDAHHRHGRSSSSASEHDAHGGINSNNDNDSAHGDYLLHADNVPEQVCVREVCRRLVDGGVGVIALCGQSSVMAVAGASSPFDSDAAATVKVLDISAPYKSRAGLSAAAASSPPPLDVVLSEVTKESLHFPLAALLPRGDGEEEEAEDGRSLDVLGVLDAAVDVVGAPVLATDGRTQRDFEDILLRTAYAAPPVSDGVRLVDSTHSTNPDPAAASPAFTAFRRLHGPLILCEHVFSSVVGGLALTPHYLIVSQSGPVKCPEQSRVYVYDRDWKQRLFLFAFPSTEPRFAKDCVAVATSWYPTATPPMVPSVRCHHALLPGEKRGELRLLCYEHVSDDAGGTVSGSFTVDKLQVFTSTPIRAVAITADGTCAVVTSEEGKRIKLIQTRAGHFETRFFSLDRGLTRAVSTSVSLHVVNVPHWSTTADRAGTASIPRYALVAMATATGTVHTYLVDVTRDLQWECMATETRLHLVHDELGVSLCFPEPGLSRDKALLLVLQFPDGSPAYARGAPHTMTHNTDLAMTLSTAAGVCKPFRLALYKTNISDVTGAQQPRSVQPVSFMKTASTWLKRDVAGSTSSGVVPGKGQGAIICDLAAYLPFQ